ncbi:MAG TPA: hypothetical protein VFQ57_01540 [Sphingomonas sp.]|jgi:flagellar motility protein MotE (MotC chaperone)|nr:hypothetical protein [Sphingomonas sp.]
MNWRPSLLMLTAFSCGAAALGNAVGIAAAPAGTNAGSPDTPRNRLGVAIDSDLSARDRQAAGRRRALDLREQAVRAAEARMRSNAPTQTDPDAAAAATQNGGGGAGADGGTDQYDNLARIYQAMKPAAAATVLEQLDLDVQMRVAQKMRERSTAMIMAAMTPKAAATLTMALARRGVPPPARATPIAAKR